MKYNIEFIVNLEENLDCYSHESPIEFKEFLELYKNIQNTSTIPIFSNSTKFNNKNKKMYKNKNNTQCIFIRNSNAWVPNSSNLLEKKIQNSIISNLNKLSADNFNKISNILIEDLQKASNDNITNIFCHELLNKNIYDKDYQDEYVKLCIKICNMNINSSDKIYKYNKKYYMKTNQNYIGPFHSIYDINDYNKNNYHFKRILLNKLYNKFMDRCTYYNEIITTDDAEIKFKKKREIHSILEFICKLFNKGVIDHNILYLIHLELLNMNCNLDHINLNIEILYNMWEILIQSSNKKFDIYHISNIYTILRYKFDKINTSYRIKFFIEYLIDTIKHKFKNNLMDIDIETLHTLYDNCEYLGESSNIEHHEIKSNGNESGSSDTDYEDDNDIEDEIIERLQKNNIYSYIEKSNHLEEYLDTLIYVVLNNMKYIDKCIECLVQLRNNKLVENDMIYKIISHSDEEIEEMMLDNNKIRDNFSILKQNIHDNVIV